jgi:SAM-dependent methyltransferase
VPPPFTTIAWRLGHIATSILGMRAANHFGNGSFDIRSVRWPGTAAEGLAFVDATYDDWITGVRGLDDDGLARPCGPAEGPFADYPFAALVLHINREVIHHGAEVACLRDLYRDRQPVSQWEPSLPSMSDDREELRQTFEAAAALYQRARPDYPPALFEDLIELTGLRPGDRLLEIGCATGKATLPLAARGFRITCIELGRELAGAARRNLAAFPDVTVVHTAFESWDAAATEPFDLVFAATAWHWVDPEVRYRKAWEALRPGAHLAFWGATHVIPDDADPFFQELQAVYEEIGEGLPADAVWPRPGELPTDQAEIEATGLFEQVEVRHYDWAVDYDAHSYIDLLNTFSGHIAMQPWQRDRLYSEIRRRLGERREQRVRRHWGAVLHVVRRRDGV